MTIPDEEEEIIHEILWQISQELDEIAEELEEAYRNEEVKGYSYAFPWPRKKVEPCGD